MSVMTGNSTERARELAGTAWDQYQWAEKNPAPRSDKTGVRTRSSRKANHAPSPARPLHYPLIVV
jgi:hypothetical protein